MVHDISHGHSHSSVITDVVHGPTMHGGPVPVHGIAPGGCIIPHPNTHPLPHDPHVVHITNGHSSTHVNSGTDMVASNTSAKMMATASHHGSVGVSGSHNNGHTNVNVTGSHGNGSVTGSYDHQHGGHSQYSVGGTYNPSPNVSINGGISHTPGGGNGYNVGVAVQF